LGAGRCVAGDAMALPIRDAAVDCATLVNAVHLMADPPVAFREARRATRSGPFVHTPVTQENLAAPFVYEYFGLSAPSTPRLRAVARTRPGHGRRRLALWRDPLGEAEGIVHRSHDEEDHAVAQDLDQPSTEQHEDVMPLTGIDHVEYYVGNAKQAAFYYSKAF